MSRARVQGDALVRAGLGVPGGEARRSHGLLAGSTIVGAVHVQAQLGGPPARPRRRAEQRDRGDPRGAAPPRPPAASRSSVALGQHDVPAVGPGPLDQVVLEHQRGDPARARHLDPLGQLGRVHVLLPQAQRGRDLASGQPALDPADGLGRDERVGIDGEHRHVRREPVQDALHPPVRQHAGGQQQAADVRSAGRDRGGQHPEHDLRAVPGRQHQRALGQVVQHGRQRGRGDHHGPHVAVQLGRVADHDPRPGLLGHLAHGRLHQHRVVREDVGVGPGPDRGHVQRVDAVGDDADHRGVRELLPRVPDRGDDVGRGLAPPGDDREHGRAEVVGQPPVQRELRRRGDVGEVAADAEHGVAVPLQLPESLHHAADQLVRTQRLGLPVREALRLDPRAVPLPHQLDQRVRAVTEDRAEEPDPVRTAGEQVHHPQREHRLAGVGLQRGDVHGPDHAS